VTAGLVLPPQHRIEQLLAGHQRDVARRRRQSLGVLTALVVLAVIAGHYSEVDLGNLFGHLSGLTSYFGRILPKLTVGHFTADVADWYWNIDGWLKLLFDTVLIAYVATLAGAAGAVLLAFLAAGNLAPSHTVRWCVKRWFEFCRTVPDLVFALVFVSAFGLGPLAGVLADRHPQLWCPRQAVHRGRREHRYASGEACEPPADASPRSCASAYCRRSCRISPAMPCCALK
jgi:ABC-type phosphate/phosphonate transport system permease subunit